ncbi:MAG: hypothetical protein IJ450_06040 [Bacteroidales bacterium]|nr:hypothetical protein [Bacteroidales bacterium]
MKNIYRLLSYSLTVVAMALLSGCHKDPLPEDDEKEPDNVYETGIASFTNPAEGRVITPSGETITCVLYADAAYKAELVLKSGEEGWALLTKGNSGEKGRNNIRIVFEENDTEQERKAELLITVDGYERVSAAVFTQNPSGKTAAIEQNMFLNGYMHDILLEDYLWADEYAKLDVDLEMDYTQYLNHHLMSLGEVNIEDGGYHRANTSNPGERFIYSNIQELVATKAIETGGLGFGPIFASQITENGVMGLSIAYVHQGSPAYAAGMKRGDTIFKVNGLTLTSSNYQTYMSQLYYNPSGTYTFEFIRDADMESSYTAEVTAANYIYNPVLYSAVLSEGSHKIGYLVLENFDLNCQEFVEDIVNQFAENSITDLILDLRFNPGGAVAQSRYLASAIAGTSHLDDTFVKVTFRNGNTQDWKFRGGPNDQDGLGIAKDLGLDRLYVIGSYGTASASELVINSLRGIDFPVYIYGGRTEGKNVGMTTTQTSYKGRTYLFSPITFRVANAKGFGDYPDGFPADVVVNNQNASYADDKDNLFPYSFGDWGSMGFNVALRYAYEDIIGVSHSNAPSTRSASFEPIPVGHTGLKQPQHGRFGNMIYLPASQR